MHRNLSSPCPLQLPSLCSQGCFHLHSLAQSSPASWHECRALNVSQGTTKLFILNKKIKQVVWLPQHGSCSWGGEQRATQMFTGCVLYPVRGVRGNHWRIIWSVSGKDWFPRRAVPVQCTPAPEPSLVFSLNLRCRALCAQAFWTGRAEGWQREPQLLQMGSVIFDLSFIRNLNVTSPPDEHIPSPLMSARVMLTGHRELISPVCLSRPWRTAPILGLPQTMTS